MGTELPSQFSPGTDYLVYESVRLRARGVQIEVGTLRVTDDVAQRLARPFRKDPVDLRLHLLEPVEVLRGGGRGLPAGPLRRFVNHDPGMREREPAARAGGLQHDGAHRIRHALDDDGDLVALEDELPDGIIESMIPEKTRGRRQTSSSGPRNFMASSMTGAHTTVT